jgi:hypothetical protein
MELSSSCVSRSVIYSEQTSGRGHRGGGVTIELESLAIKKNTFPDLFLKAVFF